MKTGKWIRAGLFMALLALAGGAYAHDGGNCGKDGWAQGEHHMSPLPDAKRQLLHQTMKTVFAKDKALLERMHKLHEKQHAILAADKFDQKAFMGTGAEMQKIRGQIHKDRMQAFASIAGQFTPEEREMLAKMHRHHHGQHGEWHHHDGEVGNPSMKEGSSAPQDQKDYPPYPSK